MIFVTQLIYVIPGQEEVFEEFERVAIPSIKRYNGEMLLRMRPAKETIIESNIEAPYEIHLVQFNDEPDFINFMQDEERTRFLHLKQSSVRESILYKGQQL